MHRTDPVGASPLIVVVREAQTVVILNTFAGAFRGIFRICEVIAEAGGAEGIHVQGWFAFDDPLCQNFTHAACATVPVERHAAQVPEAARPRHWTNDRLAVRGVSAGVTDQGEDLGPFQEGEA